MVFELTFSNLTSGQRGVVIATVTADSRRAAVSQLSAGGLSALRDWAGIGGLCLGGGLVYSLIEVPA